MDCFVNYFDLNLIFYLEL